MPYKHRCQHEPYRYRNGLLCYLHMSLYLLAVFLQTCAQSIPDQLAVNRESLRRQLRAKGAYHLISSFTPEF